MMPVSPQPTTATERISSEIVFEVAPEDQDAYARHSYHDLMHAWNDLVRHLAAVRRTGDDACAERIARELRHFWPHADDVAHVAWVPSDDRESALPANSDTWRPTARQRKEPTACLHVMGSSVPRTVLRG
jgi:hypothetical protein